MKRTKNNYYNNNRRKIQRPYIDISKQFDKKYAFKSDNTWKIPETAFSAEPWSIPSLQEKKQKLNAVKSLLDPFPREEWSKHTKQRDPSSWVIRFLRQRFEPELLTQVVKY